jgi:hypothetical protein
MANTRLYVVTPLINVQINNAIGEIARLPSKFFATSAPPRDSAALAFRVPALLLDGGAQAMTADGSAWCSKYSRRKPRSTLRLVNYEKKRGIG